MPPLTAGSGQNGPLLSRSFGTLPSFGRSSSSSSTTRNCQFSSCVESNHRPISSAATSNSTLNYTLAAYSSRSTTHKLKRYLWWWPSCFPPRCCCYTLFFFIQFSRSIWPLRALYGYVIVCQLNLDVNAGLPAWLFYLRRWRTSYLLFSVSTRCSTPVSFYSAFYRIFTIYHWVNHTFFSSSFFFFYCLLPLLLSCRGRGCVLPRQCRFCGLRYCIT